MKKSILTLIVFFAVFTACGQSVDLDKEAINVSYVRLPTHPVPDENYRTFSINVNATEVSEDAYPTDILKDQIGLEGFEKINANGTIDVQIQLGEVIIEKVDIEEREEVKKDKEGNVTSRKKFYRPLISYTTNASYFVRDHSGETQQFNLGKSNVYKASEYSSHKAASDYFKNNRASLKSKFAKEFIANVPSEINSKLNFRYGYVPQNTQSVVWILDSKKNPEYEGHQTALKDMKEAFAHIAHNRPIDEIREEIKPIVAYFENVIPKFTDIKKTRHKKMRYASYYNIAKMYYYLDMPDETIIYANKLIENGYDKSDGKYLLGQAEQLKQKFVANATNTRHFEVITTDNSFNEAETIIQQPIIVEEVIPMIDRFDRFYASNGNVEHDNEITKTLLKTLKNVLLARGGGAGSYIIDDEYTVDTSTQRIVGQKFISPNDGGAYLTVDFIWEDNTMTHADIDGYKFNLYWKDERLIRIKHDTYSNFDYTLKYDSTGNVVYLEGNEPYSNGDAISTEIKYENGRMVESINNVQTPFKKYTHRVKTLRYEDDKVFVNTIIYKKGKSRDPKYEVSNMSGYFQKTGEYKVFVKHLWNENIEYHFTPKGKFTYRKRSRDSDNNEWVRKYTYEDETLVHSEQVQTDNGVLKEKEIVNYKDFIPNRSDAQDYEWKKGKYLLNANNEVFFESKDRKYREKENGIWSPWKYMTY